MTKIYGYNIDSCLNALLIQYYKLQENISTFEHYKNNIINPDNILHHHDFIEAKDYIKKSRILLENLYIKNLESVEREII